MDFKEAREQLIKALVGDMASSYFGDRQGQAWLEQRLREGFKGFDEMAAVELIQCAADAGLDDQYKEQIEALGQLTDGTAEGLTQVRRSIVQFVVLHEADVDLGSMPLDVIVGECKAGDLLGGPKTVTQSDLLTSEQLDEEALALGSDASFFPDSVRGDEDTPHAER